MNRIIRNAAAAAVLLLAGAGSAGAVTGPPAGPLTKCPADSVISGTGCMDKYEASVWRVPHPTTTNNGLVMRIRQGTATAARLMAGGATLLGTTMDDYAPCADSGQNCANDIYAVSLPAITPSAFITWFQAQAACRNAGKRLPSNAEWQAAVAGTPDPGPDDGMALCNTGSVFAASPTGSRHSCISSRGAFDMVGNLDEWVAEWLPQSTICGAWGAGISPTDDLQCLTGASTAGEPGALLRGGDFLSASDAGPLFVSGVVSPSASDLIIGFRCTR